MEAAVGVHVHARRRRVRGTDRAAVRDREHPARWVGGGDLVEGEALVAFTLFAEPNGAGTRVQVNSKMRTHLHRKGSSGKLRPTPVYQCASTGRFEANLLDAVRGLVKE